MPVSRMKFEIWIEAMGDRWYPLAGPSREAYFALLTDKFLDDALFEAVAISLYGLEQPKFPSPQQFLDALAQHRTPAYQSQAAAALPAAKELTLAEMSPEERRKCQANIERVKAMLAGLQRSDRPKSEVFSTFGDVISFEVHHDAA